MPLNTSKNRKIYKTIFSALLGIYFIFIHPKTTNAATLFQDDFNDGDASGWEEYHPWGDWYVENKEYVGTVQLLSPPEKPSYAIAGDKSWQDYSFQVDMKGTEGVDKVILFRINEEGNAYKLNLRSGYFAQGNDVNLGKRLPIGTAGHKFLKRASYTNSLNVSYGLRVDVKNEANGVLIKIFIKDSLILEYLDQDEPIQNGAIGLEVWPGGYSSGGSLTTTHYDNVLVTTLPESFPTPSPSPILDVPDIKQCDPLWKNEKYDWTSKWALGTDTIGRWGCALTSATMVLQYHGHQINPDELNDWLSLMPDGYLRNGLLNWIAVSRYTFFNAINGLPILEYRRYGTDDSNLKEELKAHRPPIVKVPGHFTVVKGQQNSDFLVNDPASETNTLLSQVEAQHSGEYSAINSYIPTSTDLSYIMLVADGDTEISLFDPLGNPVPEVISFIEGPLEDNLNPGNYSGNPMRILLFPTPEEEIYTVKVFYGDGPFLLEAYLYDQKGNLITEKPVPFEGLSYDGKQAEIQLNYGEDSDPPIFERRITFNTALQDLEILWLIGWIDDYDVYLGLRDKLVAAKFVSEVKGKIKPNKNILRAFENQLKAQREKHMSEEAYEILDINLQALLESLGR
ncbi:C39 family peptidase [Candidatus Woesebacteria bacterium]|nr:C39 family peptidase [Candidatus Woesebacteria bacterium]